jgi:hypothetical protein
MRSLEIVALGLFACAGAQADLITGFESGEGYTGSPGGTLLTNGFGGGGQNGWIQPTNGGLDQNVYEYGGNALGFNNNPTGGKQFIGGTSGGGSSFPRAQHTHDFSSSSTWTLSYDFAALWLGQGASAANLSSFSLQPSTGTNKSYIALNNFVDLNNPAAGWKAEYNVFDANDGALLNLSPGPEWANLNVNHWYRQSTTVDFATNLITEVTLTDLLTNQTFTANPVGWYLDGGANGNLPLPTDVRFFIGGALGNTMGFDNLNISVPAPGAMALLAFSGLAASRRKR